MTAMPTTRRAPAPKTQLEPTYQSGFGNEFVSEALPGVLPQGQNSPQQPPRGLYVEQISGTPFTAPRAENRRTWLYRIRPSCMHRPFRRADEGLMRSAPFAEVPAPPNRLRWNALPLPDAPTDFLAGLVTLGGNGDVSARTGIALHVYRATRSMERVFFNSDGELLIVPQQGRLLLRTELGALTAGPGEIAVVPRGLKFRVELPDGPARGWACENYGARFRLPELGPLGANGLANPRDFLTPTAAFEERDTPVELVTKFEGHLWSTELPHSPLDVVAWHGNFAPYKYDLARFNAMGTVSFDHPDPSIYTVLTSPSETPGTANCDFVIFPPRWMVAENTFRPPWFHRNVMSEFFALIQGVYDGKATGLEPGGMSLHNSMAGHGPDVPTFDKTIAADLAPNKLEGSLACLWETRLVIRPTRFALETDALQRDYDECWMGLRKRFEG